jgi:microcystin-dependent protein
MDYAYKWGTRFTVSTLVINIENIMKRFFYKFIFVCIFANQAALSLRAQEIPISVQGVVRNADGSVFPTGNYSMKFRIYTLASGGTAIWTEEQTGIRIDGGVYSVLLGKINSLGNIAFNQTLYLGVSVDGGTELSPRALFTAAPAARYALRSPGSIPSGMVVSFSGPLAKVPDGWLPCDGRALKSSDFPTLFDRIGTTYGNGSTGMGAGSGTNFNVPDLRSEFIRGLDSGRGVDVNRTVGSSQDWATSLPVNPFSLQLSAGGSHSHSANLLNRNGIGSVYMGGTSATVRDNAIGFSLNAGSYSGSTKTDGIHTHSITFTGGDTETRPVNTAVYFFIKY